MQSLTYVIGKDKRNLVDDIQNFKIDFKDSNSNWVQARQYEDGMRQVFVTMKNEDGSPFDLTGCNYWFEGILPDGVHKILDAKHGVALDPINGQFRFDMPKQAFAVAGSYVQAFFRIMKDGASVTTLEFDLQVLADKVISGLVPRDYVTPFEDLYDQLAGILRKAGDDVAAAIATFKAKVDATLKTLNELNDLNTEKLQTLSTAVGAIQAQIDAGNVITRKQFDDVTAINQRSLTSQIKAAMEAIGDNSPKGSYLNLAALQAALPAGAVGVYLTQDDGHWHYFANNQWNDGGAYQSTGLENGSANYGARTRLGETAIVGGMQTTNIVVDTNKMTMSWDNDLWFLNGGLPIHIAAGSTDITSNNGYIMVDINLQVPYVRPIDEDPWDYGDNKRENSLVIGMIWADGTMWLNSMMPYTYNGQRYHGLPMSYDRFSKLITANAQRDTPAKLTMTADKWTLSMPQTQLTDGYGEYWLVPSAETEYLDYDITTVMNKGGLLLFDTATSSIKAVTTVTGNLSDTEYVLGSIWYDGTMKLNGNINIEVNGVADDGAGTNGHPYKTLSKLGTVGHLMTVGSIEIDLEQRTLTNTTNTNANHMIVVFWGNGVTYNPAIDLSGLDDTMTNIFVLDTADNTIKAFAEKLYPEIPETCVILGVIWDWKNYHQAEFFTDNPVIINGEYGKGLKNSLMYDDSLVCLGDSITRGYVGEDNDGNHQHTTMPYPYWLTYKLGLSVDNQGHDQAAIVGDLPRDLTQSVKAVDFTKYTMATIMIGVNDYTISSSLDAVKDTLRANIQTMLTQNPALRILGILPMQAYRVPEPAQWTEGDAMTTKNSAGWTLSDLDDAEKSVYDEFGIPTLDFRQAPFYTKTGYKQQSVDYLHPTVAGYRRLGARIAAFIEQNQ
ncbi:BppU family phage baseplate upper protein [Lactiplantibacillus plantarum]|uniref:BppU family phage baseplate upper protein n=1 Tax=Lactiplantibacillus plantarum TaxID=1590 RepID=UPI002240C22E|nr:BppU family phage baseplate upper protein [Lactiplantibacillus plantarum]